MSEMAEKARDRVGDAIDHIRLTLGGGMVRTCIADLIQHTMASQSIGALIGMYLASVVLHLFPEDRT